jgi:hypothetical protein
VKLTHLLAIIAFILALVFYAWHISHDVWTWVFFELWGLLLWCVSEHPKAP